MTLLSGTSLAQSALLTENQLRQQKAYTTVDDALANKSDAKVLDLKAYKQLLRNNSNITNLDLNDLSSMNMFQFSTIDVQDTKDIQFPVIPLYYYRLNDKFVLVHERHLKRALDKENRRRMESVMNLPGFSWTDEKSLLKILEIIQ